jgi:hypothetical protein
MVNELIPQPSIFPTLFPSSALQTIPNPHSTRLFRRHSNILIWQRKCFRRMMKNRLAGPSKICAPKFKGEFRRFRISSVAAAIDVYWSIFASGGKRAAVLSTMRKYHQALQIVSQLCTPASTSRHGGARRRRAAVSGKTVDIAFLICSNR